MVAGAGLIPHTDALRAGHTLNHTPHAINPALTPSQGDLLLLAAGPAATVHRALDRVRLFLGKALNLIDPSKDSLLWVTDFPMFELNEAEGRLEALHHPFTAPNPDDVAAAGGDLRGARALAYDLVYNGVEIGGGSLRIYRCGRLCCVCCGVVVLWCFGVVVLFVASCMSLCRVLLPLSLLPPPPPRLTTCPEKQTQDNRHHQPPRPPTTQTQPRRAAGRV